jgi:hypothetical protein
MGSPLRIFAGGPPGGGVSELDMFVLFQLPENTSPQITPIAQIQYLGRVTTDFDMENVLPLTVLCNLRNLRIMTGGV